MSGCLTTQTKNTHESTEEVPAVPRPSPTTKNTQQLRGQTPPPSDGNTLDDDSGQDDESENNTDDAPQEDIVDDSPIYDKTPAGKFDRDKFSGFK